MASADQTDTCTLETSETLTSSTVARHGSQVTLSDDAHNTVDDKCTELNTLKGPSVSTTTTTSSASSADAAAATAAYDAQDLGSAQSRKHKRKQREPRRISNADIPGADMPQTTVVKTETVAAEGVDDPTKDSRPLLMGRPVGRSQDNKSASTTRSSMDYPDESDDEETNPLTFRTSNSNEFRPITLPPGPLHHHHRHEQREIDPFQFPSNDNEDEDIDIGGLHEESMSGGSHGHGSPTSDDGGDLGSHCPSFGGRGGGGSKKNQRSYKNLSKSRRIVANARERNRVHTISAAFEGLRRAVPSYSHNQKLSKLAILRIACSYILALAKLADKDYAPDERSELSFAECVDMCTKTLQSEGRSKRRKVPLD